MILIFISAEVVYSELLLAFMIIAHRGMTKSGDYFMNELLHCPEIKIGRRFPISFKSFSFNLGSSITSNKINQKN